MILTQSLLHKIINYQNQNIIIRGTNIKILYDFICGYNTHIEYNTTYKHKDNIYLLDTNHLKTKSQLIDLLKKICISPDYFSDKINKKVIILLHVDSMNQQLFQQVKSLIDLTFMTSIFILHFTNNNLITPSISSRFLIVNVPNKNNDDKTIEITYKKIIKLLKKRLTCKSIQSIREICYMYYMNHSDSLDLQKMIVEKIGSNRYLPNLVKSDIIEDITSINKIYSYSYRKPIFLECIIYSLFKHLENYTYNL
jgi:hypothetical protein